MNKLDQSSIGKERTRRLQRRIITVYAFTITIFIIVFIVFALFTAKKQSDVLYRQQIEAGKIGLSHFVNNAAIPLLDDDALSLNALLKEANAIDGAQYVAVVDDKGAVRAHTDIGRIGTKFGQFKDSEKEVRDGDTVMVIYPLPDGRRVLDLSRPVTFMKKYVGVVHVGLSLQFVDAKIKKGLPNAIRAVVWLGLVLVGVLLCSALALFYWSRKVLNGTAALSGQRQEPDQLYWGDEAALMASCEPEEDTIRYGSDASIAEMKQNHVTVLFAGIKGFRAYAEINDHQKLMDDLSDYLSLATDCIQTYGGYIDKFVGDSVIAVFGNSSHDTNHAERALNAAVALQKALKDRGKNGNPLLLKVGIGINSGVVLTGCIGSPTQKERIFIGESIKVAYSMNVMAGPGEIVMSRDAYRMIEHLVTVEPLPPREMMQRTQPWENFRLLKVN